MDRAHPHHTTAAERTLRLLVAALLMAALGAGGWVLWSEVLRDRQPPVHGEIDEGAVAAAPLCVRSIEPPCRDVEDAARTLQSERLMIRGVEATRGGNQGVIALALEAPDGHLFKAKWRSTQSASLFNTPAKELAAYRVQSLFLDPADYVIPPAASHCFDLAHYRAQVLAESAPMEGTGCVFGFLSYWLTNAISLPDARRQGLWPMPPDGLYDDDPRLYDAARFQTDAVYRRNIAVLNLVTHLVNNRDAHAGQFVLYQEPLHFFLIDNSLAFRALPNPATLFIQDLSQLMVPSIPADVAARIGALRRSDLDVLVAIEEYAVRDGQLVKVPPGPPFGTNAHLRRTADRVQIGLTETDVVYLWRRIERLQRAIAEGRLGTF